MTATAPKSIVCEGAVPGVRSGELERFVARACQACGVRGHVGVLLAKSAKLRQLNMQYRGKNSATDVLSFPAAESNGSAGDIAISLDIAARNARTLGHSVADEIRILILHGILHLAGYDHETDQGEMERKERALRKKLRLITGLIERNSRYLDDNSSSVPDRRSSVKPVHLNSRTQRIATKARRQRT